MNPILIHMRTAAVRDLRTRFPKLEAWLRQGEPISITKRGVQVASLVPVPAVGKRGNPVDFAAQMKRIWGKRCFSDEEARNMLHSIRDGEEG
jgi:antitoxin (DNA-binding transcriptional repressor) of toxin-antitoxin stability system